MIKFVQERDRRESDDQEREATEEKLREREQGDPLVRKKSFVMEEDEEEQGDEDFEAFRSPPQKSSHVYRDQDIQYHSPKVILAER